MRNSDAIFFIIPILIAVTLADWESAGKVIDDSNRNATELLNKAEQQANNAVKQSVQRIATERERELKWANEAENKTLHAVGAATEEFGELTQNASNTAANAIGIAEERFGEWLAGVGQVVQNSTDAGESLQAVGIAAKEFGEVAKNVSTNALRVLGDAGEYVGQWLVGTGEAEDKTVADNRSERSN